MTEPTLKQVIKLLTIFIQFDKNNLTDYVRQKIENYIKNHTKKGISVQYMEMYDFYLSQNTVLESTSTRKRISRNAVKAIGLINSIQNELSLTDKFLLIILLLDILKDKDEILADEFDFIETLAISFNINEFDFYNLKYFLLNQLEQIPLKKNLLIINSEQINQSKDYKHIYRENLDGSIYILYVAQINYYLFFYHGDDHLFNNDKTIVKNVIYPFTKGDSISSYKMGLHNFKLKPIYFTEVGMKYADNPDFRKISLQLNEIQYNYHQSTEGIQKFSFSTESYLMVGIMGGSGSGKTTLLNILNGTLKPKSGKILINGIDLYDTKQKKQLKKLIGYVPQDDLLFENLTVFQNLYYNAKLCFGDKTDLEIKEIVNKALQDLDLFHIKDLKVGSETNQIISGGQRKRLNIGIELLREPPILLVDEPTSGLSSNDSLKIINILREQTLKGKLVIIVLHQPSSRIFKLLDQLIIIDKGGYIAYSGDPLESVVYFKTINKQINPQEKECPQCGSIDPDIIFEIIEEKAFNEDGSYSSNRKITPARWYQLYQENANQQKVAPYKSKKQLPSVNFQIPNRFKQFLIFSRRNILSKLANKQYLLISLLEAPILAFILAYFSKYNSGSTNDPKAYLFIENINIPAYMLMSIIVALFIGMLISADEIFNDRKILKRERFLNLSHRSYIHSKLFFLFVISAIQTLSYVLIGNYVLEIKGLTFHYWIVLYSVACFANLLGLVISSGLKSSIAIYILIPFLIIPQILLSGSIIKFDKLNTHLSSNIYPPAISGLMPSRWAFEAIAVSQFRYNNYQNYFFEINKKESIISYRLNHLIPKLISINDETKSLLGKGNKNEIINNQKVIYKQLKNLGYQYKTSIDSDNETISHFIVQTDKHLNRLKAEYSKKLDAVLYQKDTITNKLVEKFGSTAGFINFRSKNHNKAVANLVLNTDNQQNIRLYNNDLIRLFEPVYQSATNKMGREQFFISEKKLFGKKFNTVYYNILIIWSLNLLLYIALLYNVLYIILNRFKLKKTLMAIIKNK